MSPIYHWALAIVRIGNRFSYAELLLAMTQIRRGCDVEGWAA